MLERRLQDGSQFSDVISDMSERDNYRLDFDFPGLIEQIEDCGDYIALRTPSLPGFFWGNYLLFPNAPGPEDFDRWRAAFRAEFGSVEELHHEAFGWDTPTGEVGNVEPFVNAGFEVSRLSVMLAKQVKRPPYLSTEVEVRVADSEQEWTAAIDCIAEDSREGVTMNRRLARKLEIWRELTEKSAGVWYNACLDGRVVGGLGTYLIQNTLVVDDVARTAVYTACHQSIEQPDVERLLLYAEHGSAAERMYQQIGFRTTEQLLELIKTT